MAAVTLPRSFLWRVTRKNSFLVKRDGVVLSSHPMNPNGRQIPKFDGNSNRKLVTLQGNDKKGVNVLTSNTKNSNSKQTRTVVLQKNVKNPRMLTKKVRAITASHGRTDLVKALSARFSRVHRLLHLRAEIPPKRKYNGRRSADKVQARKNLEDKKAKIIAYREAVAAKRQRSARTQRQQAKSAEKKALAPKAATKA